MENLNGLLSAAFLILIAAAAAVTGSMVVLGLFDRLFSKKKSPAPDPESPGDHEQDDEDDDDLEHLHNQQMRKFSTGRGAYYALFARTEMFSATAARMSAFNAFSSILSPS
jgi:hypothetical protein